MRLEVLQVAANRYELRLIHADGTERVETFTDAASLAKRQMQLQHMMVDEGWTGPHGTVM